MPAINFNIEKTLDGALGRAGTLETPHGKIETPAFVVVGTKATIKALSPEDVKNLGGQIALGNTYHLYLQPGDEIVKKAGGLHKFMNWNGPTMTDSGGFQVFSLGEAYGSGINKFLKKEEEKENQEEKARLMNIDEDGVTFRSHIDGSEHRFTPERSIEIQHNIGADIIFAFDECTSPTADYDYQRKAMDRTHRWAERSLKKHKESNDSPQGAGLQHSGILANVRMSVTPGGGRGSKGREEKEGSKLSGQALFGIVQGGRFQDLRQESAKYISSLDFDGFGVGGSFEKEDLDTAVGWVNKILPEDKPRHLLGIGEPADLFAGIENGVDLFDCVAPTRIARTGMLYTKSGTITITKREFKEDFEPIEKDCGCEACQNYSRAYLHHLFKSREIFGHRLASIHNLYFIVNLVKKIRQSIIDGDFFEFKKEFFQYKKRGPGR